MSQSNIEDYHYTIGKRKRNSDRELHCPIILQSDYQSNQGITNKREKKLSQKIDVENVCMDVKALGKVVTDNQISNDPMKQFKEKTEKLVILWDLDETLLLFNSFLDGSFARKNKKDATLSRNIGKRIMHFLFDILEDHMFFNDLENKDQVHISDIEVHDDNRDLSSYDFNKDQLSNNPVIQSDDLVKLAYRYRIICARYEQKYHQLSDINQVNHFPGILGLKVRGTKEFEYCQTLFQDVNTLSNGWCQTSTRILSQINESLKSLSVTHLVVTNSQLVPALCKCMLYQLDEFFTIKQVYSSSIIGKYSCFRKIMHQYGTSSHFISIGDGPEEEQASQRLGFPFFKITKIEDLENIPRLIQHYFETHEKKSIPL